MLNKIINTIISNIKKYWPVYLIGLLSIVYFSKIIFNSFIPFSSNYYLSDILDLNLPFKSLLADFLQNNSLPLWSNEIATGYPVFAEGQIGSLYPLNILLYKFLPFIFAFKVSFVLHFFLAALFCYLLVRNYKLSKISSLFAALVFACSGFFIGHLGQINVVNAAVWAPLILLLLNLHYRHKKIIYIPLISLFLAIQFLAGHVQISYYTTMCVIIYFFWREIKIWLIFRLPLLKSIKSLALNMLPLLYILILFVLLISVQLLPTYYLANQSWHGNLTMEQNLEFSYHPDNLLTFINPFIYGNPADNTYDKNVDNYGIWSENIGYIGILPLFFAVLGLWSKKKRCYM